MGLYYSAALIGSLWTFVACGSDRLSMDLCYTAALITSLWAFVTLWTDKFSMGIGLSTATCNAVVEVRASGLTHV